VFSCSENEQKQLNTWVSFQSAEQPLLGQFSVSGNSRIFQIGLRAQGSARPEDLEVAREYGAELISAYELHEIGMDAVLSRIPDGGNYYLTIDADGLDPTIMPAVDGPAPGGVTFLQARKLIHGLVRKGRVVGMDIVEIQPGKDNASNLTCVTAGRLIVNLIGASIRAGYFDK